MTPQAIAAVLGAVATNTPQPLAVGSALNQDYWPYLVQLAVVTAAVAALGYFSLKFLKAKAPQLGLGLGVGKHMRVVDRLSLDPRRMMFLVAVGDRYWLLAATETQVSPIAELTGADLATGPFAKALEQEKARGTP